MDSRAPRFNSYRAASEASSRAKSRTKSENTSPEMKLRRALWAHGFRYRVNVQNLMGRPDIVFSRQKVVVFCDGDFFHGKDWDELRLKLSQRANPSYWIKKIEYNRNRDRMVTRGLERDGWNVLRFWESEIRSDLDGVVAKVAGALSGR